MKTIVVATDFSERSDRAIQRAKLLARDFDAKVYLVHVVDDDQAQEIVLAERDVSTQLLEKLTRTLREVNGLNCEFRVVLGKPFSGITSTARDLNADLIIIGPHRRQILKNILVGTTAERTIRTADRPVLTANGVPTGPYRRAVLATDLSAYSKAMILSAKSLGLLDQLNLSLLHVFNAPGIALMNRASLSVEEKQSYLAGERKRASENVASFIEGINIEGLSTILKPDTADTAETICETAIELSAELIVVGTCGRSAVARVLMGSVTEGVLRNSERDVLAVPPLQNGTES
ncbi:universal stress protein [Thalassoglobus polymorphus]|uniref:Universal stress protein E n=1 Tax=Thalassoglobus polymorphus TaxID=2527994 RepID=A0A517QNQ0_9PLAN|nr:universal stress protein [Thalassoglobus polymorphus]QDT33207.1 Universal stress protein E [Thalassoglobus polymorphus]